MRISKAQAERAAKKIGVNTNKISVDKLRKGMQTEINEHSKALGGSITKAAMVARDHLKENPRAYK